jgi:hypothetical protein
LTKTSRSIKERTIKTLIVVPALLLLLGCEDEPQKPYLMGEKPPQTRTVYTISSKPKTDAVAIARIEAESKKEIAAINMQRDLELQKIEQQTKLHEVAADKEIALKAQEVQTAQENNDYTLRKSTLTLLALFAAALLALAFYFFRKWRQEKVQMHRAEIEKELTIKEKELQVKMAEKILDTLASGKLSQEEERKLIEALEKTNRSLPYKGSRE